MEIFINHLCPALSLWMCVGLNWAHFPTQGCSTVFTLLKRKSTPWFPTRLHRQAVYISFYLHAAHYWGLKLSFIIIVITVNNFPSCFQNEGKSLLRCGMESTLKLPYHPEGTRLQQQWECQPHNTEHIPLLVERVLYIPHNQTFQIYYVRFTSSMLGIRPGPCTWKEYAQPLSYIPSQKDAIIHFYSL